MLNQFSRTVLIYGDEAMERLKTRALPFSGSAESAVTRRRRLQEAESARLT